MAKSRAYPEVECAMDGCTTVFTKTGNRQKYCPECKQLAKRGYFKDWYYNRDGRNHLKEKYEDNREEHIARVRSYYFERGGKEKAKLRKPKASTILSRQKSQARRVQAKRECRVIEMLEGGRPFRLKDAPVSGPFLTDIADYQAGTTKFEQVDHPRPQPITVVDEYAWDGTFDHREDM
jgi:hypothetical protein